VRETKGKLLAMKTLFQVSLLLFMAGECAGDVVVLKNGKTIECKVQRYAKGTFTLDVSGESQEVKLSTIESVTIGEAPAKDSATKDTPERLSLADCEPGKHGFIQTTLKVESAEDNRFIGSYEIFAEGVVRGRRAAIIQGVDTESLVSGKFVNLTQRMKCVGTENLADGQTVYVFEPFQPEQRAVSKGEDPALSRPSPRALRVQDIRGR
jgi:hypothetical protein